MTSGLNPAKWLAARRGLKAALACAAHGAFFLWLPHVVLHNVMHFGHHLPGETAVSGAAILIAQTFIVLPATLFGFHRAAARFPDASPYLMATAFLFGMLYAGPLAMIADLVPGIWLWHHHQEYLMVNALARLPMHLLLAPIITLGMLIYGGPLLPFCAAVFATYSRAISIHRNNRAGSYSSHPRVA